MSVFYVHFHTMNRAGPFYNFNPIQTGLLSTFWDRGDKTQSDKRNELLSLSKMEYFTPKIASIFSTCYERKN